MPTVSPDASVPVEVPAAAVAEAADAALATSRRAGVQVRDVEDMEELRQVSALLASVWGRTPEGVPMPSEVMRGLAHAGGCTTAAFDASGTLVGAATLAIAAPCGTTYSLIAAVTPGGGDRGIGHAVKLHQRAWALRHGCRTMVWTFDPLVSRNARFNLTKLGAGADDYVESFYGRMADDINAGDDADRVVAHWRLDSPEAVAASEGTAREPGEPDLASGSVVAVGPDGEPAYAVDEGGAWCRVPRDVVALRRTDPAATAAWRGLVREAFADAVGRGLTATGMTRTGWYRFVPEASA